MSLIKIIRVISTIIAIVGIIFGVMIVSGNEARIGSILYVAYIVLAIIIFFVVLFTLKNTFSNKHTLKSTLTGLGAFALVALICYFGLANGVETPLRDGAVLSEGGSRLVGAGLYMFYALVFIAIGSIVFNGVKKTFSK
jgi:hypothetical protein